MTVLVREVGVTLFDVLQPPTAEEACLDAFVRAAPPFIPPPLFRVEVPASAQAGDSYWTDSVVNSDYVGIHPDTGVVTFRVELKYAAGGGYRFRLDGKASAAARSEDTETFQLFEGEYRWFELDSLDGWNLTVDVQSSE